ncbi:MAG: hypothetical protein ACFFDW_10995 [Candidatus Thorarchaeota archaeon]
MNNKTIDPEKHIKQEKNIQLVRLFFLTLTFLAAMVFIGLVIAMIVIYGIDATANETFLETGGKVLGIAGIPLFSVVLVCSIVVGIINLRNSALQDEDEAKKFKLVAKEERN